MAYVKAADVDPFDEVVASRIQRIVDNQEDHEARTNLLEGLGAKVATTSNPSTSATPQNMSASPLTLETGLWIIVSSVRIVASIASTSSVLSELWNVDAGETIQTVYTGLPASTDNAHWNRATLVNIRAFVAPSSTDVHARLSVSRTGGTISYGFAHFFAVKVNDL